MLATLRNRNFALLWMGGLISAIGDWLLFIALPFYVYDLTGSALATGAMFIAETVPGIVLSSLAGVFVDRWDRRWTLIIADLLRAAVVLLILLINRVELIWIVYLAVGIESAASKFFDPAKSALIPRLMSQEQLVSANALSSLSLELTRLIGPSLGGILMAIVGIHGIVLIDSGSYVLSALIIFCIRLPISAPVSDATQPQMATPWSSVWRELVAGLRLVKETRWITGLFMVISIIMLGQGIINVMLIPFISNVLHGGPQEFAWIVTAQSIGGLSGGLLIGQVGRFVSSGRMIMLSGLLLGLLLTLIATIHSLWIVIMLMALAGWPAIGMFVSVTTMLQSGVSDHFRGRVFGAFNTVQALFMLVGLGLASLLGDRVSVVGLLCASGVSYALGGIVAGFFLRDITPAAA